MGQYFTRTITEILTISPSASSSNPPQLRSSGIQLAAAISGTTVFLAAVFAYFHNFTNMGSYFSSFTNTTTKNATSPLLQPAIDGDMDTIKDLIFEHWSEEKDEDNQHSIDETKDNAKNRKASSLIRRKIQSLIMQMDSNGNTPIIGAIYSGHLSIVQYFLNEWFLTTDDDAKDENDDDTTLLLEMLRCKNGMGCSPLWIAAGYGRDEILQYLIQTIATVTATKTLQSGEGQYDLLLEMIGAPNETGDSPFLAAVSKGHSKICQLLLESIHEYTTTTTVNRRQNQRTEVVSSFYDLLCQTNKAGDTPLSVCVSCGHDGELFSLLLDWEEKGLQDQKSQQQSLPERPLDRKSPKGGVTPLLLACERNNVRIVEELICNRRSTLHSVGVVSKMLAKCDDQGRSPLAVASFCGCMEVVQKLLSLITTEIEEEIKDIIREMINEKDQHGCTPLWLASRTGNAKMVQVLLNAGADKTLTDAKERRTPEEVAIHYKKDKVVDCFSIYAQQVENEIEKS